MLGLQLCCARLRLPSVTLKLLLASTRSAAAVAPLRARWVVAMCPLVWGTGAATVMPAMCFLFSIAAKRLSTGAISYGLGPPADGLGPVILRR